MDVFRERDNIFDKMQYKYIGTFLFLLSSLIVACRF